METLYAIGTLLKSLILLVGFGLIVWQLYIGLVKKDKDGFRKAGKYFLVIILLVIILIVV